MNWTRRDLLKTGASALGASSIGSLTAADLPKGKADACIFLWLGGGAAHMDTFDPKLKGDGVSKARLLLRFHRNGHSRRACLRASEKIGAAARPLCAGPLPASRRSLASMGPPPTWCTPAGCPAARLIYPSIGSIVSHELGSKSEDVPAYVVMGYPNITRDPGFLGSKYGYVYLLQTETGPNGLVRPPDVDQSREERREALLGQMRKGFVAKASRRRLRAGANRDRRARFQARRTAIPERLRSEARAGQHSRGVWRRVRAALPARPASGPVRRPLRGSLLQPELPEWRGLGYA